MRPWMLIGIVLATGFLIGRVTIAPTAKAVGSPYAAFSGKWGQHGAVMSLDPSGRGTIQLRTYTNCGTDLQANCDRIVGNYIYDGAYMTFTLRRVASPTKVLGTIESTSASWMFNLPVTLSLLRDATLRVWVGPRSLGPYCRANNWKPACGA